MSSHIMYRMTSTVTLTQQQFVSKEPYSKDLSSSTSTSKVSSFGLALESMEVVALTILSPLGLLLIFTLSAFRELNNITRKIAATWNH
jgi:hypothetical protein